MKSTKSECIFNIFLLMKHNKLKYSKVDMCISLLPMASSPLKSWIHELFLLIHKDESFFFKDSKNQAVHMLGQL